MPRPVRAITRLAKKLVKESKTSVMRRELEEAVIDGRVASPAEMAEILSALVRAPTVDPIVVVSASRCVQAILKMRMEDVAAGSSKRGKPDESAVTINILNPKQRKRTDK